MMDEAKQRDIASKGVRAAHEQGTAHEFTAEEAREAGRKGGQASQSSQGNQGGQGGEKNNAVDTWVAIVRMCTHGRCHGSAGRAFQPDCCNTSPYITYN